MSVKIAGFNIFVANYLLQAKQIFKNMAIQFKLNERLAIVIAEFRYSPSVDRCEWQNDLHYIVIVNTLKVTRKRDLVLAGKQ